MRRQHHWEKVYRTSDETQVSWYQADPEISLRLVEAACSDREARILDAGGGTSRLVDRLLERGYRHVGVLDVSGAAIEIAQKRLGERAIEVEWFVSDVIGFHTLHPWDVWHDRAVFHFLDSESDRLDYRASISSALAAGGQLVIGTFGPEGPERCSGLDVTRYSADRLADELGDEFELLHEELVDHSTPGGAIQQFLFCRFLRK
jgi:SAM-dependent methyltransferase